MNSFSGLPSSSVLDTMYDSIADTKRPFAEVVAALDWQGGGPGRILVSVTARHVYTIHKDDEGFWELERYEQLSPVAHDAVTSRAAAAAVRSALT